MALTTRFRRKDQQPKQTITLTLHAPKEVAEQAAEDLQMILKKCSGQELSLLAKAINIPYVKNRAIQELNNLPI